MSLLDNRLFLRSASIVIFRKNAKNDPTPKTEPEFALSPKVRIAFSVEKTSDSLANKAEISLYNLNPQSLSFLEDDSIACILKAGHGGDESTIFNGDIVRKISKREGPDIVTTLETGDNENMLQSTNVDIALGPGAKASQVMSQATSAMGLDLNFISGFADKTFLNGFSYTGPAKKVIDDLTQSSDVEWNITDGVLNVLPAREVLKDAAVLITPKTGLLGWPTKTKEGIQFTSILNPFLNPARLVKIESKQFYGLFGAGAEGAASSSVEEAGGFLRVRKVIHKGDTREGDWTSTVEGVGPSFTYPGQTNI